MRNSCVAGSEFQGEDAAYKLLRTRLKKGSGRNCDAELGFPAQRQQQGQQQRRMTRQVIDKKLS
jgi:hypothetical protein